MNIPDEAGEAAAKVSFGLANPGTTWEDVEPHWKAAYLANQRAALEAAAPILLSHEREETRLAHVDAVVNRDTVDKLQAVIDAVLALHRELPCLDEDGDPIGGSYCEECKDLDDHSGERVHEVYPCLTVREITSALDGKETYTAMRDRIEANAR